PHAAPDHHSRRADHTRRRRAQPGFRVTDSAPGSRIVNYLESLRVAWRALRVNKMRSMLTALGIIVGVAAVVCMVSVGAGAQAQVSEKIRTLGANLLLITPGAQSAGAVRMEAGTRHTLTEDDATAIRRNMPAVQVAAPVLS